MRDQAPPIFDQILLVISLQANRTKYLNFLDNNNLLKTTLTIKGRNSQNLLYSQKQVQLTNITKWKWQSKNSTSPSIFKKTRNLIWRTPKIGHPVHQYSWKPTEDQPLPENVCTTTRNRCASLLPSWKIPKWSNGKRYLYFLEPPGIFHAFLQLWRSFGFGRTFLLIQQSVQEHDCNPRVRWVHRLQSWNWA